MMIAPLPSRVTPLLTAPPPELDTAELVEPPLLEVPTLVELLPP